jgi:P27 family predicted phage terminase small subunit
VPTPRKAIEQHSLNGTKPHYTEPGSDETPGRPKYPRGISGEAKGAFKRLVKLLESRRTCTAGDAEILRLYAITFDRHTRALVHLAAEGEICAYTRLDSNGQPHEQFKANLWLDVATNAEKFMRSCLADLGLNPLSRGKVKPTKTPAKPDEQPTTREETTLPEAEVDLNSIDLSKVM